MEIMDFAEQCDVAPWKLVPDDKMTWFLRWRAIGVQRAKRHEYQEDLRKSRG